jgi:hypothetical protein
MSEQTMHQKVNRNLKHVSVIACVSAVGEKLIPYVVTSQDSVLVREQLKKRGVRFGTDFILTARAKPHIKTEIVLEYISTVFLPNLNELRSLEEFADQDAIFLMDDSRSDRVYNSPLSISISSQCAED